MARREGEVSSPSIAKESAKGVSTRFCSRGFAVKTKSFSSEASATKSRRQDDTLKFADALVTLASMIDIPVDATVHPLLVESRSALAYYCLIDDTEAATTKDRRALRQLAARFVICGETLYRRLADGMLLLCLGRASADRVMREVHAGVCGPHMGGHMLAPLLYSKVFLLLTIHEPCREKGAGNLKVEANFAALRHPLVISCEFVKESPRLKITLNGINFVDYFLNQGAPAEHKSAETPIGHESTMETDCCQFVQRCPECQIHGDLIHVPPSELHALTSPWPFPYGVLTSSGRFHRNLPVVMSSSWSPSITSPSGWRPLHRGVHFRAEVDTLVQQYGIRHHRSFAYRPQTNGAVEAANKNIKRILQRMVETSRDWRLRAADHVRAYQRKMVRAFKKRVKPRPLRMCYLVLKFIKGLIRDPRGKFRPNWSGPYFIKELTLEGTAWLMDLDGNRFLESTIVDQLKRSDSIVFGLPGSFMDPHGLARSSSLTGCSLRCGHDRYLTEPPEIYPARSALLDTWMPSCFSIREVRGFPLHPFNEVHVRSFVRPHGVTLELSGQISFYPSTGIYCICLTDRYSCDFRRDELSVEHDVRILLAEHYELEEFDLLQHSDRPRDFIRRVERLYFRVTVLVLAFRAIIGHQFDVQSQPMLVFPFGVQSRSPPSFGIQSHLSSFGVQSHYPFPAWLSEPPCLFVYDVQSRLSQHDIPKPSFHFGVQSIVVSFWRSEPLIISQLDVQSHMSSHLLRSESTSSFDVQSHAMFHLAYRATVHSRFTTFGVTMPHFQFGVQSHHFSFLAFRAIIASSFEPSSLPRLTFRVAFSVLAPESHQCRVSWFHRSKPSSFPSLTFRVAFPVSTFKAIIASSFGVQGHHSSVSVFKVILVAFLVSTFRAIIITSQFRRSEPLLLLSLTFRVVFSFAFRAIFCFVWHSKPLSTFDLVFRATDIVHFDVRSHTFIWSQPLAFIFADIIHLASMALHLSSFSSPRYPVLIAYPSLLLARSLSL
ncbi:hypothetical protein CK203_100947 [Vitis vinifera]|uniref:Integrase catalytic domain-containing protein n=1 Tax=Vitis vinifera TaxID=29760 RepID=A0A438CJE5_VITVI|nr:hypothetical protein CK203_100947 [Vitis vinifera]